MIPQGDLCHTRLEAGRVRASVFDQDQSVSAWTQQNPDKRWRVSLDGCLASTPTLATAIHSEVQGATCKVAYHPLLTARPDVKNKTTQSAPPRTRGHARERKL